MVIDELMAYAQRIIEIEAKTKVDGIAGSP